jgi:hypothetical protein
VVVAISKKEAVKMAINSEGSSGFINPDGTATVGGRPGVGAMYENLAASDAGLPPKALRDTAPAPLPGEPAASPLPFLHVAQQHLGREIGRLQEAAVGLEREIGRGCWGANGTVLPHLLERRKQLEMDLAGVRADIAALKGMTDHECQVWASGRGVR